LPFGALVVAVLLVMPMPAVTQAAPRWFIKPNLEDLKHEPAFSFGKIAVITNEDRWFYRLERDSELSHRQCRSGEGSFIACTI
jgi:hypothetical protein